MVEAIDYIKTNKDSHVEILGFIKKFSKLKEKEAKELKAKIEALDLMKINESTISKIIDILPENAEELNKIFVGISLNDEETKKILELVKEFK